MDYLGISMGLATGSIRYNLSLAFEFPFGDERCLVGTFSLLLFGDSIQISFIIYLKTFKCFYYMFLLDPINESFFQLYLLYFCLYHFISFSSKYGLHSWGTEKSRDFQEKRLSSCQVWLLGTWVKRVPTNLGWTGRNDDELERED